ncbi:MAG: hypothetical protein GW823_06905 [Bacteroidetes bacterium]|nr:hypothetical protein [Bacteroidota bacterium]
MSPSGKEVIVTILKRAIDFDNEFIDEPNFKGNFDYLVSIESANSIETKKIFCRHIDLK